MLWLEEPTIPEDWLGYARIRSEGGLAIAQGENLHTLPEFVSALTVGNIDFPQPVRNGLPPARPSMLLSYASDSLQTHIAVSKHTSVLVHWPVGLVAPGRLEHWRNLGLDRGGQTRGRVAQAGLEPRRPGAPRRLDVLGGDRHTAKLMKVFTMMIKMVVAILMLTIFDQS